MIDVYENVKNLSNLLSELIDKRIDEKMTIEHKENTRVTMSLERFEYLTKLEEIINKCIFIERKSIDNDNNLIADVVLSMKELDNLMAHKKTLEKPGYYRILNRCITNYNVIINDDRKSE